jgi:hypothetical protein
MPTTRRFTFGKQPTVHRTYSKPGKTSPVISHDEITLRAGRPKTAMTQRAKDYARGGKDEMFGKQAANEQRPGSTAHKTSSTGGRFAAGGDVPRSGGLAVPAKLQHTGPSGTPASVSTRDYEKGGEARPARPGRCAP